jgi:hypothetical protein
VRHILFYFKRTTIRPNREVTTEVGVGSALLWALVLLVLGLAGKTLVGIPWLVSQLPR